MACSYCILGNFQGEIFLLFLRITLIPQNSKLIASRNIASYMMAILKNFVPPKLPKMRYAKSVFNLVIA